LAADDYWRRDTKQLGNSVLSAASTSTFPSMRESPPVRKPEFR
jgi:hypothetical protein